MLQIRIPSQFAKWSGLAIYHNWFYRKPVLADAFRFAQYYHCQSLGPYFGFRRRPKFTSLIDLTKSEEAILQEFSETTRYEVRRAARDNLRFELEDDLAAYCEFAQFNPAWLVPYSPFIYVTKAVSGDHPIVMHANLFDPQIGRVALYQSTSSYHHVEDSGRRNSIGRANRWLHYQDMLLFKRQGAMTYDFGGIAKGADDLKLRHVNEFKEGFGGTLVEESNYVSAPVIWWNKIIRGSDVST